jgi:hypothetical protein
MKWTVRAILVFSLTLMSITGCLPNHLAHLNGKIAYATLSKTPHSRVSLINAQGNAFYLESDKILVSFEINRIGSSFLKLTDELNTAKFEIPRPLLNQRSPSVFIPAATSKQPYDLQIDESTKILESWTLYREEEDPVYISSCSSGVNGNFSCTQTLVGFDSEYFSEVRGHVEHLVTLTLLVPTQNENSPKEVEKAAELQWVSGAFEERLNIRKISEKEYLSHRNRNP